ncbi:MAG TPA: nuclear transport factor 2 family protein [Egibacteraceae bacterium]|nr:nuclear transport factor 2 family protein [Actinomycetota bacterium]HWB72973.1 nuclear transport factor 2 family protein [Egibacteraceae bacterium]
MGRVRDLWEQLSAALEKQDVEALLELYAPECVFLEPQNPPHEGNLLVQAYLNSWLQARDNLDINTKRLLESPDGSTLAVEWTVSYSAGGRRWRDLPRSSWFEAEDDGITYQRDYF